MSTGALDLGAIKGSVELDVSNFERKYGAVDRALTALASRQVRDVKVGADTAAAEADLNAIQSLLTGVLDGMTAEVSVTGDTARADAAIGVVQSALTALDGDRAEVSVGADVSPAESAIAGLGAEGGKAGEDAGEGISAGVLGGLAAIPIAGGIALIGVAIGKGLLDGIMDGLAQEASRDLFSARTGLDAATADKFGRAAGDAYGSAWGTSVEENLDTARLALQGGLIDADATTAEVEEIIASLSGVSDLLGEDIPRLGRAVGVMVKTEMVPDAQAGLDILVAGMQSGANVSEDLLDTFTEYPAVFEKLGLDGQTSMGLISQAMQAGARDTDYAADALKEFQIRATDASDLSAESFELLGLNAEDMTAKIARGGADAEAGLGVVLDRLRDMEDPVLRNQAAVGLFGTKAEDLGDALFAMDPGTAVAGLEDLGDVAGRASGALSTLSDNGASDVESAKRSIELSADGIKGAMAAAFTEPLGELAEYISTNRAGVLEFLGGIANGMFELGAAGIESVAAIIEAFGQIPQALAPTLESLAETIVMYGAISSAVPGMPKIDTVDFLSSVGEMHAGIAGVAAESAATADALRDTLIGQGLDPAQAAFNDFLADEIVSARVHDLTTAFTSNIEAVGASLQNLNEIEVFEDATTTDAAKAFAGAVAAVNTQTAEAAPLSQEAAGSLKDWREEMAGISASFIDFSGAMSTSQSASEKWAQAQEDSAEAVADAQERVADAQEGLARAEEDAAQSAQDAARQVVDARQSVADAHEDSADAVTDAQSRVTDAQEALTRAEEDAADSAQDAARQVTDARRDVEAAYEDSAAGIASALDRQAAAEESLVSAQDSTRRSLLDLSDARRQARQDLEDYTLSVQGSALGVEGAEIALERARIRANEVGSGGGTASAREWNQEELTAAQRDFVNRSDEYRYANSELLKLTAEQQRQGYKIFEDFTINRPGQRPGASSSGGSLEAREADLAFRQAKLRLTEARESNKDLLAEAAAARKAGVEGAEVVISAQERVTKSRQDELAAQRDIVKAQQEVIAAQEEGAAKIADAQVAVSDAIAKQAQVVSDSNRQVAETQQSILDAQAEVTRAQEDGAEKVAAAQVAVTDAIADQSGAVVDAAQAVADAQEAILDAQADAAQASADAAVSQTVTVESFLSNLETMGAAQEEFELNLLRLSGRVSQGVLDELARLGPEGAPFLADLVDAGDEEFARLEAVFGQGADGATGTFATRLQDAQPVIRAAAAQLGLVAADEIAAQIQAGDITAQEAVDKYNLVVDLDSDLTPAQQKFARFLSVVRESSEAMQVEADDRPASTTLGDLVGDVNEADGTVDINGRSVPAEMTLKQYLGDVNTSDGTVDILGNDRPGQDLRRAFIRAINTSTGMLDIDAKTTPAQRVMDAFFKKNNNRTINVNSLITAQREVAAGGFFEGGVQRLADGGYADGGQSVPRQSMMGGPQFGKTNVLWGEPETGWEAYISGKPGMEARNLDILEQAANRLGVGLVARADGAFSDMLPSTLAVDADMGDLGERLAAAVAEMASTMPDGPRLTGGWRQLVGFAEQFGVPVTSTVRPGAKTLTGKDSKHAAGDAADTGLSKRFWDWLEPQKDRFSELYSPWGLWLAGQNRWNYPNADVVNRSHQDHIHMATYADGGILDAMANPKAADAGSVSLDPEWNMVYNGLGRIEHLAERPAVTQQAAQVSLDGVRVEGRFEVGADGFLNLVDGRIRVHESQRTRALQAGVR